jgi:hypothetical protein
MKKILVLLLVIAAAGGVFALDGEWSLSGSAEIGTYVDFDTTDGAKAAITSSTYWLPYGDYNDYPDASLNVGYNWEALQLGLSFSYGGGIGGELQYDGGNYKFQYNAQLAPKMFMGNNANDGGDWKGDVWSNRLWGYYKLLNELVHLEVAYNSRANEWWASDKTAFSKPLWDGDGTFADVDQHNFLLAGLELENLSLGIMMKDVFRDDQLGGSNGTAVHTGAFGGFNAPGKRAGMGLELVDEVLKKMVFGVKFNMQPIEVAAQFKFDNYGVYFGGKWSIGPVGVGLSFAAILDPDATYKPIGAGVSVGYSASAFGADLKGWLNYAKTDDTSSTSVIGIEPGFFYNVIPTHLRFKIDAGLYFSGGKVNGEKQTLDVNWGVQPQLFWNFLGTGAGDYYGGLNTGMIVRYRLSSISRADDYATDNKTNALDVTFKFNF